MQTGRAASGCGVVELPGWPFRREVARRGAWSGPPRDSISGSTWIPGFCPVFPSIRGVRAHALPLTSAAPNSCSRRVIPPTKTAMEKAAKRRTKIVPRLREIRDSGDPGGTLRTSVRPSVPAGSGVREAQAPGARTDGRTGEPVSRRTRRTRRTGRAGPVGGTSAVRRAKGARARPSKVVGRKAQQQRRGGAAVGGVVRLDSPGARLLMKAADRQTLTDLRVQGTALLLPGAHGGRGARAPTMTCRQILAP
ncbi:hypothetical protein ABID94_003318 [Streptomyces sp. PvR018]